MLLLLLLSEKLLQLYPVGVTLKDLLLTKCFVIGHHSLRMDEHYYNVMCVLSNKRMT